MRNSQADTKLNFALLLQKIKLNLDCMCNEFDVEQHKKCD